MSNSSNRQIKTFLSLCCSSLRLLFSPLSFSRSRQGSLAPSSRPCWTRCCMLIVTRKRTPPKINQHDTVFIILVQMQHGCENILAYSVTVVRSSLSLRFCSSRWMSFSRSCNRVVSRQTSNSRVFSWSWTACCSASRSWYTAESCFMAYRLITSTTARADGTCSYLFVLALVVLQGGQVRQVTLQSLDTLLVFSLQLRLLLALFLQVVDVFVPTANLHKP